MQYFRQFREYVAPLLKDSKVVVFYESNAAYSHVDVVKFRETGVLTPEEFVAAGDFLVFKCPTWQWAPGQDSKRRDYLPANKQYLITRNVPCHARVASMEYNAAEEDVVNEEDVDEDGAWVTTHSNRKVNSVDPDGGAREILDMDEEPEVEAVTAEVSKVTLDASAKADDGGEEVKDIPDDEELELVEAEVEEDDPAAVSSKHGDDKILRTRTYDMSITYDKYYQTPRVWLFGYDENRRPLTAAQVFEDISQDHAKKTVTIETHPHENLSLASIHPCKHGNVMKRLIDQIAESDKAEELRVDQYLLLFLKFMSSVLPTMEYDYTVGVDS